MEGGRFQVGIVVQDLAPMVDLYEGLLGSFSRDDLCTLLTLYWATESFVTSVRYYREPALSK
jgi:hypothetical protein